MTAVIAVTPRGIAGHFLYNESHEFQYETLIKNARDHPHRCDNSGNLADTDSRRSYQASSIPSSQLVNPNDWSKSPVFRGCKATHHPGWVPRALHAGHIPDSEYIGPASSESGLHNSQDVAPLPRDKFIVIYCGCCPGAIARTSNLPTMHCARWVSRTSRCSTSLTISARTGWTRAIPLQGRLKSGFCEPRTFYGKTFCWRGGDRPCG